MRAEVALTTLALAFFAGSGCKPSAPTLNGVALPEITAGVGYTNQMVPAGPWSIHVVRLTRETGIELQSVHAGSGALGLSPLSEQVRGTGLDWGTPVAAVNGDFYQREKTYAGDPRGLQIVKGEVISAPAGTAAVWVDGQGLPHAAMVQSQFSVTWPGGKALHAGLNQDRGTNMAVLFTAAIGPSTHTTNAVDVVLERDGNGPWLPLQVDESYSGRVREVREGGNAPLTNGAIVVSVSTALWRALPPVERGGVFKISTGTSPELKGAKTAIGGGPLLVRDGKKLKIDPTGLFEPKSYSARSMEEQHPRTAVGWNDRYFYFVEVDGRQKGSVGMKLTELRDYMAQLGCTEAVNLDGGGSATLWVNGAVANTPCDGFERPIANGLVAVRKRVEAARKE